MSERDATPREPTHVEPVVSTWVTTVDTVFPHHANPLGTLFGGRVLELMDVSASIACTRFCRHLVVTASTEPIDFRNPIYVGEIIELKSRVAWVGRTSMIVRCEVHGENPLTGERRLCTIGHLNFVAIGPDGRPTPVPPLRVATALERHHYRVAQRVREALLLRQANDAADPGATDPGATDPGANAAADADEDSGERARARSMSQ